MKKYANKLMTVMIVVLGLAITATSCGSKSGRLPSTSTLTKAKVKKANSMDSYYLIKYVDPIYEVGDRIVLGGVEYSIISFDNKECRFEGAECPNVEHYLRDYQIEVYYDTVTVYDGDRVVGIYVTDWTEQLDRMIYSDQLNQ